MNPMHNALIEVGLVAVANRFAWLTVVPTVRAAHDPVPVMSMRSGAIT